MADHVAMKSDPDAPGLRVKSDIDTLEFRIKSDLEALELRMTERIEKVQTTMLKEFRKWAVRFETPIRANQVLVAGFHERLSSLEERMEAMEQK